jgi:uncharacterized membrane-anchored protein YitT (DUF2179 family)
MNHHHNTIEWDKVFNAKNLIYTFFGVLCATFAMKGFMIPNAFMDGGVTGISILLHEIYHVNISIPILLLNIVFVYLGAKYIGKTFAVQTSIAIVLLALGLLFFEVPKITSDKLLIALFGGFFIGVGMGLVLRSGGVIDGFEILAVFTTKKIGVTISEIILVFNGVIFLVAALKLGIETSMYSIVTYFTAVKMCDYVSDGIEEFISLSVIAPNSEVVKSIIVNDFGKGISVYKGERGYLPGSFDVKVDCEIVVTIVTRLELLAIKNAIAENEPKAFMFVQSVKEAKGGVLKKKHAH